ncbi:MAG: MoaD/ThiS family protein [Thermoflexales bacterium]|nr:MoaD/ThiS family protein [Thermoflexales bacterium]MCX7939380.1 MoaD/ThiS family protein [Thermoflexales bacterium]MDW8054599.1 MoaD/ThiS family protein [Anaerolineae bacterium]MDW8292654.1 MoaD/ThiS family protein [Anaerolineae bacterium]
MAVVWIPPLLRSLTNNQARVVAEGDTVQRVLEDLERRYPGLKARLLDGDRLKPNFALVVDGVASRQGLRHPVRPESEIHFVPAMSGG